LKKRFFLGKQKEFSLPESSKPDGLDFLKEKFLGMVIIDKMKKL